MNKMFFEGGRFECVCQPQHNGRKRPDNDQSQEKESPNS